MKELNGRVALVTGADSGMGRSIALAFAAAGASVLVTDVNETPGDVGFQAPGLTTVQAIRETGGEARFLKLDVRDEAAVEAAVATAHAHFGAFDIMVNNAGVLKAGLPLHKFSSKDLDFCYEVNLRGSWNGTMAAIRYFLAHGKRGNIVNVVSTAGINPFRLEGPYAMTKAGAAMLVRNAASEYAEHGIRINGVCPTFTRSRMTAPVVDVPEIQEFVRQFVPLGRMAEPTEIADAVVFLASSRADFITGVLLPVDGGESVGRPVPPSIPA